jgi:cell division protein FtsQ
VRALAGYQSLLANGGHVLTELRLSSRGAWQVVLASGATIDLGRSDAMARLEKFIAVSRNMPELTRAPFVDLRHEHGFAVRHAAPAKARDSSTHSTSTQR